MRRLTRILLWTAGVVLTLVLVTGVVLQTTLFKQWLRGVIVRQVNQHLNGTLAIGSMRGSLFSGVELNDVAVTMGTEKVIAIDTIKASYSIRELVSGGVSIDNITLVHPVIAVHREFGDGWQFSRLVKKERQEADRRGPDKPVRVRHINIVDGSFAVDKKAGQAVNYPGHFDKFNATLSFAYEPVHFTIGIDRMTFAGSDPELAMQELSGAVAVRDDNVYLNNFTVRTAETKAWIDGAIQQYTHTPALAMQVSLTPLSLPEVHRLVPAMKEIKVSPDINVKLSGPMARLATEISVRSRGGDFAYKGTVGLGGPDRVFQGELAVHHLDLAPFLDNPEQKSDIVAYAKVNLHGPAGLDALKGSVAADAPLVKTHGYVVEGIRANAKIDGRTIAFDTSERAYRSNTTSAGTVVFASDANPVTTFDLRGVVKDVGVAYLPTSMRIPPADTRLTADYHVRIELPRKPGWHLDGDVVLDQSTVAGVDIAKGATASFAFGPNLVQYQVDMNVAAVDLKSIGEQFNVAALINPRYQTSLNGHVVASVNGSALETMTLTASGNLTDSSAFGGRLQAMTFETAIADDALHVKAAGQVEKIDPAIAAARPSVAGSVTGTVDADLTFAHLSKGTDLESVEAVVTAELGPSVVGDATIDKAYISGDFQHAVADVYQLDVSGSDVTASGHGTLAFNETDKSGFWIHAEASHLEQVASVARPGSEHPVFGIGTLDAIVGGNRKEFTVTGTATGNGLKYDDYGALAVSSKFSGKIPNLDAGQATVTADTHATFVELPGFNVNDLTAKTDYRDRHVDFNMTATQPQRNLTSAGSLILHPDHREVHLTAFKFDTQGMTWQIGPGHSPAITYGDNVIGVKDLSLVNGAQEVRAEGTFGDADETLTVNLKDVDLGVVDAWLLRPPQLSGKVNAKAVVSGATTAPHVETAFTVTSGKFRDISYESFGGTLKYTPALLVMDTKLQQNASQWLTAKGDLPMSLFKGKKSAADKLDFHVDSSNVDLGIVQGMTSALSMVKGTLQAKLDLTGTTEEPRIAGGVTVKGGGFKAEDSGVTYKALDGKIEFLSDRVHITDLHVLDNDNESLSLTGDLGVSGFTVSAVNLGVYAQNFKVLANEMGTLRVGTNLELTGTLAHPKLTGDLDVSTGSLNLDPIIARLGNNAYATTAADTTEAAGGSEQPARQGLIGAVDVAIHVNIPDALVVKASDLKTSSGPIGLGAVNLTLGGDLNVSAAPNRPLTLVGSVNTVRGYYDYQGRRFTILRDGRVRFEGDAVNDLNPSLDVSAERVIQAVTARVNVRGRLRRPNIELTSTPPQEQADILALIVFNQPLNTLGEGQQISLAQRAGSIAAGAVTNQLTGSIASSLNLDQFEINLLPDSGNTAELTVGQQVGQNLYVKVQQGIGDHSQTNFILEYEFKKWMRLQTNVLEGSNTQQQLFQRVQSTGLDLVFSFSFK